VKWLLQIKAYSSILDDTTCTGWNMHRSNLIFKMVWGTASHPDYDLAWVLPWFGEHSHWQKRTTRSTHHDFNLLALLRLIQLTVYFVISSIHQSFAESKIPVIMISKWSPGRIFRQMQINAYPFRAIPRSRWNGFCKSKLTRVFLTTQPSQAETCIE
jgi:hypothetical protein